MMMKTVSSANSPTKSYTVHSAKFWTLETEYNIFYVGVQTRFAPHSLFFILVQYIILTSNTDVKGDKLI